MYSSMRVGRKVRSSWRSSSLAKLSFTRADIDSGAMMFSNPCEFLETASQNSFDREFATFGECGVDRFLRRRTLVAEIEQSGECIGADGVFGRLCSFRFRAQFLFELSRRQLSNFLAQLHDQAFGRFLTHAGNERQTREVVSPDR